MKYLVLFLALLSGLLNSAIAIAAALTSKARILPAVLNKITGLPTPSNYVLMCSAK
jgi:hypothetical protein